MRRRQWAIARNPRAVAEVWVRPPDRRLLNDVGRERFWFDHFEREELRGLLCVEIVVAGEEEPAISVGERGAEGHGFGVIEFFELERIEVDD